MKAPFLSVALVLALLPGGCGKPPADDRPVVVSAIGGPVAPADPDRGPLSTPQAVFLSATAQGLVRFDANGQIIPGLAERWIVIDDARSYIFRLREAEWPDGSPVTAEQVATALRRVIAPGTHNPLAENLRVIDEIVAMTPQVVEVRLRWPRPDLLKLFAQPELAVLRPDSLDGSGPFRVSPQDGVGGVLLRPGFDPQRESAEEFEEPGPGDMVRLRGERAAMALARYAAGQSDLVLGGSFADWPLIGVTGIAAADVRSEIIPGLFGFAIVARDGFLADAANRRAVAMAFDRETFVQALSPGWAATVSVLPARIDSAADPALPDWAAIPVEERRALARTRVRLWDTDHAPLSLRIAVPHGPGGSLLWIHMARALRAIGITPHRVAMDAPADLRVIDAVAPYDSARWYLAMACRQCSEPVVHALDAAREAPDLARRARRIAEADAALAADSAFIPIARPLRWSIVSQRLGGWQANPRAWHPLDQLKQPSE